MPPDSTLWLCVFGYLLLVGDARVPRVDEAVVDDGRADGLVGLLG